MKKFTFRNAMWFMLGLLAFAGYTNAALDGIDRLCIGSSCIYSFSELSVTLSHRITVSSNSTFTGIKQATDWINANATGAYEVLIDAGQWTISDTVVVSGAYPTTIRGLGFKSTTIKPAAGMAGKPMFKVYTPTEFYNFNINADGLLNHGNAVGEDGFEFIGAGNYHQISDIGIYGFNKGIYMNNDGELRLFNSSVSNNKAYGSYISGSNFRASNCNFLNNPVTHELWAGSGNFFTVEHDRYSILSGQIAVEYQPTRYLNYRDIAIFNENFEQATNAVVISGIDFTLQRDSNIEMYGNIGTEDRRPHAKINLAGGITSTTYTQNIRSKLVYTATDIYKKKWGFTTTGRLTFLPSNTKSAYIFVSAAMITSTQPATVKIAVIKNGQTGTQLGTMSVYLDQNARAFNYSQNIYLDDVKQGDYYELYINPGANNEDVILQDMNMYVDSR